MVSEDNRKVLRKIDNTLYEDSLSVSPLMMTQEQAELEITYFPNLKVIPLEEYKTIYQDYLIGIIWQSKI